MLRDRRKEYLAAAILVGPFVVIYGALFVWPTIQMLLMSFTDAPLIGPGEWVGFKNYVRILTHKLFSTAFLNTGYFVLLTVIPNTLVSLAIAMAVNRLKGWKQGAVMACFFLPYILPVSVVFLTWNWIIDVQYGMIQYVVRPFNGGEPMSLTRTIPFFMPTVAVVTIWWTLGFNVLLFIAGLRNVSPEIYEARLARQCRALAAVQPHHLAADLAGDGPGADHTADRPAQDLRPGLPVLDRGAAGRDDRAGAIHLQSRLPAEQGRRGGRRGGDPVWHDHRALRAPVSTAPRPR